MNKNDAESLRQKMETLDAKMADPDFQPEEFWEVLQQKLHPEKQRKVIPLFRYWSHAAAFLLLGSLLTFWLLRSKPADAPTVAKRPSVPAVQQEIVASPKATDAPAPAGLPKVLSIPEKTVVHAPANKVKFPEKKQQNSFLPTPPETPVLAHQETEFPEMPIAPMTTSSRPRAPYLLDAAPGETIVVKEEQPAAVRKIRFPFPANQLSTQTAFHSPSSILQGLRK